MTVIVKPAWRALVVAVALSCKLVLVGGVAAAEEPPSSTSVPDSTPSESTPELPPDSTPDDSVPDLPPDSTPSESTPSESTPSESTPEPAVGPAEAPDASTSTETSPGGPTDVTEQEADVTNAGAAVANTGGNVGAATGEAPAGPSGDEPGSGTATIASGTSVALGSLDETTIDQQVVVDARDFAIVDILQVALVVNLGLADAQSGGNAAAALSTSDPNLATAAVLIATGNAFVIGNQSNTAVAQLAALDGSQVARQVATILNLGIALGNTGLNLGLASVDSADAPDTGASAATASIGTGVSDATGSRAFTQIVQVAIATASGSSSLSIAQQAIVLNIGLALALSGGNTAGALGDGQLAALSGLLEQLFGPLSGGTSDAQITTGSATAVGNDSQTRILQMAEGETTDEEIASARQLASVANVGLAFANSGANFAAAGGADTLADVPGFAELTSFLALLSDTSWLESDDPFAGLTTSLAFGDLLLHLDGALTGTDLRLMLEVPPDGSEQLLGGVRIRQISGVLNIGVAVADSGHNLVVAAVTGTADKIGLGADGDGRRGEGRVSIRTGNARAVGNSAIVGVCQTIRVEFDCDLFPEDPDDPVDPPDDDPVDPTDDDPQDPADPETPVEPTDEPSGPPADAAEVVSIASPGPLPTRAVASLPFTGSDSSGVLAVGLVLVLGGGAVIVITLRRRPARG